MNKFLKRQIAKFRFWLWVETSFIYEPWLNDGFNAAQIRDFEKAEICITRLEEIFGINDCEVNKLRLITQKFKLKLTGENK
jgi:hypothetical protein